MSIKIEGDVLKRRLAFRTSIGMIGFMLVVDLLAYFVSGDFLDGAAITMLMGPIMLGALIYRFAPRPAIWIGVLSLIAQESFLVFVLHH